MPQVPDPTTQQVMPSGQPSPYLTSNATPDAFGAQIGQGLQRVGAAGNQLGNTGAQAALAFQGIQNETDAKNADIQLANSLTNIQFDPKTGYNTKLGKDAVDGYQPYQDAVQKAYQDARSSLTSPDAQKMFDMAAVRRVEYALSSGAQHAAQQNKLFQVGTSDARIATEQNTAANYWNDDPRFGLALNTIKSEVLSKGELLGWGPEQVAAEQEKATSSAWVQRISRSMLNDPLAAQKLYLDNQESILPQMRPQLEEMIKHNVLPIQADGIVQKIVTGITPGQSTAPVDNNSLHAAIQSAESNGKRFDANGNLLTSSAGAKGEMQVLDSTNLNPGFGVRPAVDNSPAERARVGNDYIDAMMKRYNGNPQQAVAAYNAGPGSVDKALAAAKAKGDDANWMQYLPKPSETIPYVNKVMGYYSAKAQMTQSPDDLKAQMPMLLKQADAEAELQRPGDVEFKKTVEAGVLTQLNRMVAGQEATQHQNYNTLISAVTGPNAPTDLATYLSQPQVRQAWGQVDPAMRLSIQNLIKNNARSQDNPLTPQAESRYYSLKGMAASDPETFSHLNLMDDASVLPKAMWHELVTEQAQMNTKQFRDANKQLTYSHAMSVAKPMLLAAGIPLNNKAGSTQAQQINEFSGRLMQSVDQFQTENKRLPKDDEVRSMVGSLLTQGAQAGTSHLFGLIGDKKVHAFETDPSQFYVPVPDGEKSKIVGSYQRLHNGANPTDAQIKQIYTIAQMRKPH